MTYELLKRVREDGVAFGLFVSEGPTVTEIAAEVGLDWVALDMEHGQVEYRDIVEHLRAAKGSVLEVLVRVPTGTREIIGRVLDCGAAGVLVPMVRKADDVKTSIAVARYPPVGDRGIGYGRAAKWGMGAVEYLGCANDGVMVVPIIETVEATENLDEILRVDGVSAIFIGTVDLTARLGRKHTREQGFAGSAVVGDIVRRAREQGVVVGAVAKRRADIEEMRKSGCGLIGLGSDTGVMAAALRELLHAGQLP